MFTRFVVAALAFLLLPAAFADRAFDAAKIEAGRATFQKNCAVCHGVNASGPQGDWRKRDAAGKLPPPPLNGTAHTWHHSSKQLMNMIRNGSVRDGGNMPAWKDTLSDEEITATLEFIKSLWPEEIYRIWQQQWGEQ